MKPKLILCITLLIWVTVSGSYASESPDIGFININGELKLDFYTHKLGNDWAVVPAGYKGINKNYSYNSSSPTSPSWENLFGQTLFLNVDFYPTTKFSSELGLEIINDYADRYWMPVNFEHRLKLEDKNFSLCRADINYKEKWWSLRYFRNIGHYNWSYEGDLFNLFPEQNEAERYLRVSGRSVPEGYQLNMNGSAGKLDLIYGPEVVWDYKKGLYANYAFDFFFPMKNNIIYRDHEIPYGEPEERLRSVELSSTYDFSGTPVQLAFMYQPFRLNREYTYVQEVAEGSGLLGSKYIEHKGKTASKDALGISTKLIYDTDSLFDKMIFQCTYNGLVAGNKQEISTQFFRQIFRSLLGSIEYTYRKPLLGPVPLIFEGTVGNPGPPIFEPRGPQSPFWVSWENEATGWDNREASILSFVFTFDPTPGTWFYRYQPNVGEEWNLNPDEDAPVSFSARYTLEKYFSGTDRLLFWDENGHMVWEPPLSGGAWPTKDYIGSFSLLGKMFVPGFKILFDLGFGDSLGINSFAYTTSTSMEKPITGYFTAGIGASAYPYDVKFRYNKDYWGPEDWHHRYGQTFDNLYMFYLSRSFGKHIKTGIEFLAAHENDKKYYAIELGDYDEVRAFFSLSFGPLKAYMGSDVMKKYSSSGIIPEKDITPPVVSIVLSTNSFSPDGDNVNDILNMELWAADHFGIAMWEVFIKDANQKQVKIISGEGHPPFSIDWAGKDDVYDKTVPEGIYNVEFSASDEFGNISQTEYSEFNVIFPPKIVIKEVVREVSKEIIVVESERGLKVTVTSKFLFASGKSKLKKRAHKALDEIVNLLEAYKDNSLVVEGHTDSIGSTSFNQKLSEKRAWSVANFLIESGIAKERISVLGFGESKSIESNNTAKGREANRRVEVIILKK